MLDAVFQEKNQYSASLAQISELSCYAESLSLNLFSFDFYIRKFGKIEKIAQKKRGRRAR